MLIFHNWTSKILFLNPVCPKAKYVILLLWQKKKDKRQKRQQIKNNKFPDNSFGHNLQLPACPYCNLTSRAGCGKRGNISLSFINWQWQFHISIQRWNSNKRILYLDAIASLAIHTPLVITSMMLNITAQTCMQIIFKEKELSKFTIYKKYC